MEIYGNIFNFHIFTFFFSNFNKQVIIYIDLTHIAVSDTAPDDVTN